MWQIKDISEFQYNCLCRFEDGIPAKEIAFIQFQYNCLCRFETKPFNEMVNAQKFQYNCLCRFEKFFYKKTSKVFLISIQLFVSVRVN